MFELKVAPILVHGGLGKTGDQYPNLTSSYAGYCVPSFHRKMGYWRALASISQRTYDETVHR